DDEIVTDRQAEAGALEARRSRGAVYLHEWIEDDAKLVGGNAAPCVRDPDTDRVFDCLAREGNRTPRIRELDGVGQQVEHDLLQPLRIGVHGHAWITRDVAIGEALGG